MHIFLFLKVTLIYKINDALKVNIVSIVRIRERTDTLANKSPLKMYGFKLGAKLLPIVIHGTALVCSQPLLWSTVRGKRPIQICITQPMSVTV